MPAIHDTPPAEIQKDLNNLAQALDTIVPFQRVSELKTISQTITTRFNEATPQLDLLIQDYYLRCKR